MLVTVIKILKLMMETGHIVVTYIEGQRYIGYKDGVASI